MDGSGDLEDLGVEDDAGIASGGGGADDVRAHGAARSGQVYVFVADDDHVFLGFVSGCTTAFCLTQDSRFRKDRG